MAPFPLFQLYFSVLNFYTNGTIIGIGFCGYGQRCFVPLTAEWILNAGDMADNLFAVVCYAFNPSASHIPCRFIRIIGKEREKSMAAMEVGSAHAGESFGFCGRWRNIDRNTQDSAIYAVFFQFNPQCFSLPEILHFWGRNR